MFLKAFSRVIDTLVLFISFHFSIAISFNSFWFMRTVRLWIVLIDEEPSGGLH